jgi:hypothetical protein
MPWALRVRRGPKVAKSAHADLAGALVALEAALGAVRPSGEAQQLFRREYGPDEQVAARGELRGPDRRRGGADLRGDGAVVPWTGWLSRRPVPVAPGESAYAALSRVLEA